MTFDTEHSNQWQDRLQDAIDGAPASSERTELQAHLDSCPQCRDEYARLTSVHMQLRTALASTPTMGADFSKSVFTRINEQEHARKLEAKARAEQEFRRRAGAFDFDWREFLRRHAGNVVAAIAVMAALIATLSPTWSDLAGAARVFMDSLPWVHRAETLSIVAGFSAVVVAATSLWWLRSRTQ